MAIGETAEIAAANYRAVRAVVSKRRGSAIFDLSGPDEFGGGTIRRITRAEEIQIAEERIAARLTAKAEVAAERAAVALHKKRSLAQKAEQRRRAQARADKAILNAAKLRALGIEPYRPPPRKPRTKPPKS